jgi:hypothetical protein
LRRLLASHEPARPNAWPETMTLSTEPVEPVEPTEPPRIPSLPEC